MDAVAYIALGIGLGEKSMKTAKTLIGRTSGAGSFGLSAAIGQSRRSVAPGLGAEQNTVASIDNKMQP